MVPEITSDSLDDRQSKDQELLKGSSDPRQKEIVTYGRAETFAKINNFLKGDIRVVFALVNHVPAILDDQIDADGNTASLSRAKVILAAGFNGDNPDVSIPNSWEQRVYELGQVLSNLNQQGFDGAQEVFDEVVHYWVIEEQNLRRRHRVLCADELDKLNTNIGKSVGMQFLHLLAPDLTESFKIAVAESYGLAIKLADNLSDLSEDIENGFINISQENIDRYNLDIQNLDEPGTRSYIDVELQRIQKQYELSDECLRQAIESDPSTTQALLLFKEVAHSWLRQVMSMYLKPPTQ